MQYLNYLSLLGTVRKANTTEVGYSEGSRQLHASLWIPQRYFGFCSYFMKFSAMDVTKESGRPSILKRLQAELDNAVASGLPGVTASIGTSNGIIWKGSAGFSDIPTKSPIDSSHVFGIGSITKVFVAVVVLQLVEEQRLSTEAALESLLEEQVVSNIPHAAHATIGDCLKHFSGIPSWEDDPRWIVDGRGKNMNPSRIWGKRDALEYVKEYDNKIPQGQFSYSNSNHTLLGLVIEIVTGNTAESEIRRRILDPCGLESTYLEGFESPRPGTKPASRYHWITDEFKKTAGISPYFKECGPQLLDVSNSNLSVEWTAGGIVSTPSDLVTFGLAIRDGRLLSPSSLQYVYTWFPGRANAEIGHGLFRAKTEHGFLRGHNGSVLGFTGSLWWCEDSDCVISVVANVGTMHCGEVPAAANTVLFQSKFLPLAISYSKTHRDQGKAENIPIL